MMLEIAKLITDVVKWTNSNEIR